MKKLFFAGIACALLISCEPKEHHNENDKEMPVTSETGHDYNNSTTTGSNEAANRDLSSGDTINLQRFQSDTMNQENNNKSTNSQERAK